jgi:hypothetical protein
MNKKIIYTCLIGMVMLITLSSQGILAQDIIAIAGKSEGKFTKDVRDAFIEHCMSEALSQLKSIEVELTDEQLDFVLKDEEMKDACFGTVYPADARILLNVLELRHQLGQKIFAKYKGLCIANAVVRRNAGLG